MIRTKIDLLVVSLFLFNRRLTAVFIWRMILNRVEIEAQQFYPMKFMLMSFPCYQ